MSRLKKFWTEIKLIYRGYPPATCEFCSLHILGTVIKRVSFDTGVMNFVTLHAECVKEYDERKASSMPMENKI